MEALRGVTRFFSENDDFFTGFGCKGGIEPGGRLIQPERREPIALLTGITGTGDNRLTLRDNLQILSFKSPGISQ